MALCPHCKRPKLEVLHTLEDWNISNCLRTEEYCKQVAPYEAEIAKRDAQLTQAQAEIAAFRECVAITDEWRKVDPDPSYLHDWTEYDAARAKLKDAP